MNLNLKDDEGLIFKEIRSKVLNEEHSLVPKEAPLDVIHATPTLVRTEVTNHVKVSLGSGFKFGLGLVFGCFVGVVIVSISLVIIGAVASAIFGNSVIAYPLSFLANSTKP